MRLVHASLFGAIALLAPLAHAQPPAAHPQKPLADSLQGPAKDAYTSASLLYKHGDFSGAETKYNQAYELSKDPRLIFNMAVCEKELHRYARMQAFLVRYRTEAGASLSADDRASVDAALGAIKNLVGAVVLTANVSGADVAVDDEAAGTTPLAAPLVIDLGKHKLVVHKDGYETVTKTIDIPGGGTTNESVTLTEKSHTGQLVVAAEQDATIAVDGTVVGTDRFDGPLAAGTHEVRVTAPGKVAYRVDVELKEGESRTLQVSLASDAHRAPIWPWIVGGAVAAVGIGVGAYFLFRPQDQTNGVPSAPGGTVGLSSWGAARW